MSVDLDSDDLDLGALPRFQRAAFQLRQLLRLAACLAGAGIGMLFAAQCFARRAAELPWPPLLADGGGALLLLAGGLHSASQIARWRARAAASATATQIAAATPAGTATDAAIASAKPSPRGYRGVLRGLRRRLSERLHHIGMDTFEAAGLGAVALVVLLAVLHFSGKPTGPTAPLGHIAYLAGGVAVLIAFGLLVLERYFADRAASEWPEAARMALLTRVAIASWLISSLSLFAGADGGLWPGRLAMLAGLLPAMLALEWLLRAILAMFGRRLGRLEPRLLADSFVAGLLSWPPRPLRTLQHELHSRFGIDLRQNWAFSYIRRAFLPVLAVIASIGWLLSGLHEIPFSGRAVYERFGRPVAVFGPGLHAGLPWPFSTARPVDNGVVRELATSLPDDGDAPERSDADGPAPDGANRLWDASHENDRSQLIASIANTRQSFQIVNMDVRFIYRIALTDAAALAATYDSADVPTLIRSTASRVLVRDFAARTLDGVIGEARAQLASDITRSVQTDLDALGGGVEILATIIEAIHPPAGAANAYHAVQAAQIKAQASIARERGYAAERINEAQLGAAMATGHAVAAAREVRAGAEIVDLRFTAEQQAYRGAGNAFLLEQYLGQLSQGLSNAKLVILDHRLGGELAPTIDLRSFAAPLDPTSRKSEQ
jgi:regulator of protease activity HflC (stomatin/prohibitin superfamily)